ncbi:hypothetical protein F5X99DRAFT_422623 [Biscogniauxia marginata]|nr:hypothetical protein F5X99DRAFT_422623 [Biscogniauxia marginata]
MSVLQAVLNHLVLPPQIPGGPDEDVEAVSHDVLMRLIHACRKMVDAYVGEPWTEAFQSLQLSLDACLMLNRSQLAKRVVLDQLRQLKPKSMLILHVVEQNAAILIRYDTSSNQENVILESFETSATSEQVLAASQALQWDFPGRAVRLPHREFADEAFQENLAAFLEQASLESLYSLQAQANKAGVSVSENRDTTDPALITQMLMPLLEAIGTRFEAPVLRKRVRDEVNLQGADLPWRRLPFWLVLRVAAQRQLCLTLGSKQGRMAYKFLLCIVLAKLLEDSAGKLNPHLVVTLRAKLGRRMAKLEMDRQKSGPENCGVLFSQFGPVIEKAMKEATAQVETAWDAFKRTTTLHIPKIHSRAPASALKLSLPNSGKYLDGLLANWPPSGQPVALSSVNLPTPLDNAINQAQKFTDHIFHLTNTEASVEHDADTDQAKNSHGARCQQLAEQIAQVFTRVGTTYDSDPEQMSAMILTIFTLWTRLDRSAIAECPLLADYRPPFSPEMLDVLQLPTMSDMCRLQSIQTYIAQRRSNSRCGTILDETDANCLAVRYVATSDHMQHVMKEIQHASDRAYIAKENEWKKACREYEEHTEGFANGTCVCTWQNDGQRDVRGCTRCWHQRARKRMKIEIQEEYLPKEATARAAIVFELTIPSYLSAYRDATWQIVRDLAHPSRPLNPSAAKIKLQDCAPLKRFVETEAKARGLSLASTIKCFNQTHYKFSPTNVPLSRVFLPLAASFELFDNASGLWVHDLNKTLTLQHLCGVHIPHTLKATILPESQPPKPTVDGPSSYEVQANQSQCPSSMSVHEFSAYQKLLAGQTRRWLQIIIELGSSNLNLSNEDTTRMLCQLAIQAGPPLSEDVLRTTHVVFREHAFLDRLLQIIEKRIGAIHKNWREHNCMELLITLSLRLFDLSSGPTRLHAEALLKSARDATLDWTVEIRKRVRTTKGANAVHQLTTYGFCAALLCRRTFAIHVRLKRAMSAQDIKIWIQASLALQENLLVDIARLPQALKSMLIRDTKMAYHMQPLLRTAITTHPASVGEGILTSWSDSSSSAAISFSSWNFLASPHNRWVVATATRGWFHSSQVVHCNIIEGHLLVDGKPRGKLPSEIRNSKAVGLMFGDEHLLAYPSSLPGMMYCLETRVDGQEVHFALRNQQAIIRTYTRDSVFEFVPKETFTSTTGFDIPAELVDNCTHWLNLNTKYLEIRRAPAIWNKRPRDWVIDVPNRQAFRANVSLVDPKSDTFRIITGVLGQFERPDKLTVYQPQKGRLSIEARHLELSFYINNSGLLECRQLKAEIDPNQDAGTWYGLRSKIVLRDLSSRKRSIIIRLGSLNVRRLGMHVEARIDGSREYGRYVIDEDLGRLSCPPEPRLLYTKAHCHAMTSFCLPDTLTGRTGTEEAFHILQSGAAQPWVSLSSHAILKTIEALAPHREYYPPNLKRMQKTTWDDDLTPTIQHDGFESLVHEIMTRSIQLSKFDNGITQAFSYVKSNHLRHRGEIHRRTYERPLPDMDGKVTRDIVYVPRDRRTTPKAYNVYEIAHLISTRCSSIHMNTSLKTALESYEFIGGFTGKDNSYGSLFEKIENPINEQWGDLVNFCRHATNKAPVLFRLGMLAFGSQANMDIIRSLIAVFSIDELKDLSPPASSSFVDFKSRGCPSLQLLEKLIVPAYSSFRSKYSRLSFVKGSAERNAQKHRTRCEEEGRNLARHILNQWPAPACRLTCGYEVEVIDTGLALDEVRKEWTRRQDNEELDGYINRVQKILHSLEGPRNSKASLECKYEKPAFRSGQYQQIIPSIRKDLLVKAGPCLANPVSSLVLEVSTRAVQDETYNSAGNRLPPEFITLETVLKMFAKSPSVLRQQYAGDLLQSLSALKEIHQLPQSESGNLSSNFPIGEAIDEARNTMRLYLAEISAVFAANDCRSAWLHLGGIWPCTTPTAVLETLRSSASNEFGPGMKESLIRYGLAITILQRLERIRHALQRDDRRTLDEELRNPGHENWQPLLRPDWLLLEIDGNLLIRAEQVDVANAIIIPPSGENSVLQMNMGKGKTSCIVPMVMAILADGENLSRLIVPKALLMQTAQMMQLRLGSLVGRRVCHVPFSRKTPADKTMLELYAEIHRRTREERGLILTSQENVLSFKLGGWQQLAEGKLDAATTMIKFQAWLNSHCRDVLDECDFTLSVKTQLNYPGGEEAPVDGHPYRWQVAEGLLALAAHHVPTLRKLYPGSIEVLERAGSFPMVRFVKSDVEDALHERILDDICAGRTTFLRPADLTFARRYKLIRHVLSAPVFDDTLLNQATTAFSNPRAALKMLLVIRGLLMNGILTLCLGKRWNVQYGLHPSRYPIAVPFEAKGIPSEQSEFGHPDVAILFTCLSFYYSGLTPKQFSQGLGHILQSDDPAAQYEWWISNCRNLPEALHHWDVINVDDTEQMAELWRHLRLDRIVIDHYLNHFVFPAHAKQFEVKLQASAWDMVLFSKDQKEARTTGFSGTNDNRVMLPLSIQQNDLPSLQQTSAEVLSYILQPQNCQYKVITDENGRRLTEKGFLKQLCAENIRVLIDAGAYILEMDNKSLATEWLSVDHKAKAAIYFGKDNRAWVTFRGTAKEDTPLLATPYADDLSDCLVYIDEAHTRGVDLKLPVYARGGLTLALKQTKDYTVQAAMRLRQLRTTQSVIFFAPLEVNQSIKDLCCPDENQKIDSSHVISWLLEQSCRTNEDLQGLYVAQGIDFCRRTDAVWCNPDFIASTAQRKKLLSVLRQPERQTLNQLYGGDSGRPVGSMDQMATPKLQVFGEKLTRLGDSSCVSRAGALEVVEQEREVQVEFEQVRQVQKRPLYEALSFPGLHASISHFVRTGLLDATLSTPGNCGFEHAFSCMARTTVGNNFSVRETASKLFVSKEFGRTIKWRDEKTVAENFLRGVEWILWSPSTQTALVVIPEEVELLIPTLRLAVDKPAVHLIAYAAPVTKAMLAFNNFDYYSLPQLPTNHAFPEWFRVELGILAGRLYIDFAEWDSIASFLRPAPTATDVSPERNTKPETSTCFSRDASAFVMEWLTLRRRNQDILHTPMGYLCTGRTLEEGHPFRQAAP